MLKMRNLVLFPTLLILASCASFGSAERRGALIGAIAPERARIDAALLEECSDPVAKPAPESNPSDKQIGRLWDRDRGELRQCKSGKHALIEAVKVIEAK